MDDSQESSVLDDSQGQEQEVVLSKLQKSKSQNAYLRSY